jgi:hypothetical protein
LIVNLLHRCVLLWFPSFLTHFVVLLCVFMFILHRAQGDCDLFINPASAGFYHRVPQHRADGTTIDSPPAVWSSMRPNGIDSVAIASNDAHYVHGGAGNAAYYVTVYGYEASQYLLRVSTAATATLLVEGFTLQDTVAAHTYKYYRLHDSDPMNTVYFDLLPSVGDADLYVGCIFRPTGDDSGFPSKLTGHSNFSSQLYLEDTIGVSPNDPHSCSLGASGDSSEHRGDGGVFYLAVYGYSDATFTLNAMHTGGEKTLVAGQPVSDMVYRRVAQRYRMRLGFEGAEIRFLLTPDFGDADIFVKFNSQPSTTDYQYASANYGAEVDTITIPEEAVCSDCWVHVLVYGFSTTRYSLLASSWDGTNTLSNGVPQRGSVSSNSVQFYDYPAASADCTLVVVLTVTSGAGPTLRVSPTAERPDSTSADTVSRSGDYGSGALPRVEYPGVLAGQTLHVAVEGAGHNVTYTVRVHEIPKNAAAPPTLLVLTDGMPQVHCCTAAKRAFFSVVLL